MPTNTTTIRASNQALAVLNNTANACLPTSGTSTIRQTTSSDYVGRYASQDIYQNLTERQRLEKSYNQQIVVDNNTADAKTAQKNQLSLLNAVIDSQAKNNASQAIGSLITIGASVSANYSTLKGKIDNANNDYLYTKQRPYIPGATANKGSTLATTSNVNSRAMVPSNNQSVNQNVATYGKSSVITSTTTTVNNGVRVTKTVTQYDIDATVYTDKGTTRYNASLTMTKVGNTQTNQAIIQVTKTNLPTNVNNAQDITTKRTTLTTLTNTFRC